MVPANCSICGSDDYVVIAERDAYFEPVRNVICRTCGLVYLNPVMSEEEIQAHYARYRINTIGKSEPDEHFIDLAYRLGKMRLRHIAEYLGPHRKILDVGCGHGYILDLARALGCEGVGVEPDPGFSAYGRRKYGLRIFTSLFENASLESEIGTFDVVTFQHTFEHFRNPVETLKKVRSLLKDDGILNMDIPNLDTPRGGFLWQDLYIDHTQTYTERTLRLLLKKTGFNVLKLNTDGYVTCENYHVPLMNVTAGKGPIHEKINYTLEGDDYRRILFRTRLYRLRHLIMKGGWRFYAANLPLKPEPVRIQGHVNEGILWTSPLRPLIPGSWRRTFGGILRKTIRPYRFIDFSLPPAKEYALIPQPR